MTTWLQPALAFVWLMAAWLLIRRVLRSPLRCAVCNGTLQKNRPVVVGDRGIAHLVCPPQDAPGQFDHL